jgi:hypothetical protein
LSIYDFLLDSYTRRSPWPDSHVVADDLEVCRLSAGEHTREVLVDASKDLIMSAGADG